MSRMAIALAAAAAMTVHSAGAAELADPVGFRGYNLGITLDEFRKMPFVDKANGDAKPFCTGDKVNEKDQGSYNIATKVYGLAGEVGVIRCGYYRYDKKSKFQPGWGNGVINIADIGEFIVDFWFTPKGDDPAVSQRLYEISFMTNIDYYARLTGALEAKYGPPHKSEKGSIQNKAGANFDAETLLWANDNAEVRVQMRVGRVDTSRTTYTHLGLNQHVNGLVAAKNKAAASKL